MNASKQRGIDWTQVLRAAGIPEPAWEKPADALPAIEDPALSMPDETDNWMHR